MKIAMTIVATLACACGGKARGVDTYRADTQRLLDTRADFLRTCYDQALATHPGLAGTVKVSFVVAKKTGQLSSPQVDPAAPAPLGKCVVDSLQGLALQPPDRNEGRATFVWAFDPASS